MEIVFFLARSDEATRVASSDDLPADPAAEPMTIDGPEALLGLGPALGIDRDPGVRQLRDATCRSYPVWALSQALCARLEALGDDQLDRSADGWQTHEDSDPYERELCLRELRDALRGRSEEEGLFAFLEERAF